MDDPKQRHARVSEIYLAASGLDPERRDDFLEGACDGDDSLKQQVEALLASDHRVPTLLQTGGIAPLGDEVPERLPRRVGPYRILGKLGEGGMGVVFLAEQQQPVERRVALKLIRRGVETDAMLTRLRHESRLLARLNHPNIAQIYDAGITRARRSYIAMEFIEGEPVTGYSDRNRLGLAARLELFRQICLGVEHAHQRAIVHRDIKPSNVLVGTVDGRAVPKVIDFGIARTLGLSVTHQATTFTGWIGTPEYMSPEQAGSAPGPVDQRSDVYSLGVLLFELLVGVLPSEASRRDGVGVAPLHWMLDDSEPPLPSRLAADGAGTAERAEARGEASAQGLARRLRGDLDWITLKALQRYPDRRYRSAGELADDIARFSRGEPLSAAPPSRAYRLRRFATRHKKSLALGVVLLFLCGSSIALWDQRRRAEETVETLARIKGYLRQPVVTEKAPIEVPHQVADATEKLGLEQVSSSKRVLVELSRIALGPNHPETLSGEIDIAASYVAAFCLEPAEPLLLDLRDRIRASLPPHDLLALRVDLLLGRLYTRQRRLAEAEVLIRSTLKAMERSLGADNPHTLEAVFYLGSHQMWAGRMEQAEAIHRQSLPRMRRRLGDLHETVLGTKYNLACAAAQRGDRDCAIDLLREALEGGFFFLRRGEDDHMWNSGQGISVDPDLASLHGDREFEGLLGDGSTTTLLLQANGKAQESSEGVKRLVSQVLDRGVRHPEWIPRVYPGLAWLADDPEFGPILTAQAEVPPPRCPFEWE